MGHISEMSLDKKPPPKTMSECYDRRVIKLMITYLEQGYSVAVYNTFTISQKWKTILRKGKTRRVFAFGIALPLAFNVPAGETVEAVLRINLEKLLAEL